MADERKSPWWTLWLLHAVISLSVGVCVFATTILASWIQMRKPGVGSLSQRFEIETVHHLASAVRSYAEEHGHLPEQLSNLGDWADKYGGFEYAVSADGEDFELFSLGCDGKSGGVGLDADIYHDGRTSAEMTLPLRQFLNDTETHGNRSFAVMFELAFTVTMIAAGRDFITSGIYQRGSRRWAVTTIIAIISMALVVAILVTPFHIPSGH